MAKNMNDFKPVRIGIEVLFGQDSRKVTPADLERATEAAKAAVRATLEGRANPYKIKSITATVEYVYVQVAKTLGGKLLKKVG